MAVLHTKPYCGTANNFAIQRHSWIAGPQRWQGEKVHNPDVGKPKLCEDFMSKSALGSIDARKEATDFGQQNT